MIWLEAADVLGAIGLPAADETDEQWAELCAQAANSFVNKLPVGKEDPVDNDTLLGGLMLASNMYRRRPAGTVLADQSPEAAAAVDGTISRLLQLGYYQHGVIG